MNERERRKQELLDELARRFRDSANNLRDVARRINRAAKTNDDGKSRLERAGERLREYIDSVPGPLAFTYLEFVEFTSADEFRKFKAMPVVSREEIEETDMDDLCRQLQAF